MSGELMVPDAMRITGESRVNIYQSVHRGVLPSYKIPGSKALYFKYEELEKYKEYKKQLRENKLQNLQPRPVKRSAPAKKTAAMSG